MTPSPRRRWTDDTIVTELAPLVAELGRMPKRSELMSRGLGGAWSAMGRRGGVEAFASRLLPELPPRQAVERRAYFIAQERGGDPVSNWLAAEAELLLLAA